MVRELFCIAALVASTGAADAPAPLLSIAEIQERHEQLDGRTVRIQGWITGCEPAGCILAVEPTDEPWRTDNGWVSIEATRELKKTIQKLGGKVAWTFPNGRTPGSYRRGRFLFIEMEGIVDRTCFNHAREGVPLTYICPHAHREILDTRLIKVIKSGPAPQQGRN